MKGRCILEGGILSRPPSVGGMITMMKNKRLGFFFVRDLRTSCPFFVHPSLLRLPANDQGFVILIDCGTNDVFWFSGSTLPSIFLLPTQKWDFVVFHKYSTSITTNSWDTQIIIVRMLYLFTRLPEWRSMLTPLIIENYVRWTAIGTLGKTVNHKMFRKVCGRHFQTSRASLDAWLWESAEVPEVTKERIALVLGRSLWKTQLGTMVACM